MENHLFIIWEKALYKRDNIISEIKKSFIVLNSGFISWDKNFSVNISRFYGQNLNNISHKIRHCGSGSFYLIIVNDINPKYDIRDTSKGYCLVNTNVFDTKNKLRKITGGGHKIHATNNKREFQVDITKLFGLGWEESLKNFNSKNLLVGHSGWSSVDDLFEFLNHTTDYVILRNFKNISKDIFDPKNLHPDIDILCKSPQELADLIGAKKNQKEPYRKQYYIFINGKKIFIDLRGTNENYYCYAFSKSLLDNKIKSGNIYIPCNDDYFYSLVYHTLIHKSTISYDYKNELIHLMTLKKFKIKFNLSYDLLNILNNYFLEKNYSIVEPEDLSVFYNVELINKIFPVKVSSKRSLYNKKLKFKYVFIRIIKKILGPYLSKKIKTFFFSKL